MKGRPVNTEMRKQKEAVILENARLVFCEKGYSGVTMSELIKVSGLSRGGMYLYFSSVEEVFLAVVERRSQSRYEQVLCAVEAGTSFDVLLDDYLSMQTERLLNLDNSLLRATYEYVFTGNQDRKFGKSQLYNIRRSVTAILELGVKQGKVKPERLEDLVDHIVILIEGIGVLILSGALNKAIVDRQFEIVKTMIEKESW